MTSKGKLWTGRILSGLATLFLLVDAGMKIAQARASVDGSVELGYPANTVVPIGVALLICTLLYVLPRTAPIGAVLITAYLGGAVATQVRVGNPWLGYILFPVYVAILVWGGLYLRDRRVQTLITPSAP